MELELVSVRLTRKVPPYNEGEIAGFSAQRARELVDSGHAVPAADGDALLTLRGHVAALRQEVENAERALKAAQERVDRLGQQLAQAINDLESLSASAVPVAAPPADTPPAPGPDEQPPADTPPADLSGQEPATTEPDTGKPHAKAAKR
jgi:hypothetical protein